MLDAVTSAFEAFPNGPEGGWVPIVDLLGDEPTDVEREALNRAVRTLAAAGRIEVARDTFRGGRRVRLPVDARIALVKRRHTGVVEVARAVAAEGGIIRALLDQDSRIEALEDEVRRFHPARHSGAR